jgi:superfamily II DNA/RNA helicase
MVEFKELGLKEEILRAIEERGYTTPTPIQEMAIPYVLMGRDVLGCAQTGTGKTAGFCLPMLEILSSGTTKARMPRSLILEPTRELAAQVAESFTKYGKHLNFTSALRTGGYGMEEQIKKLDRGVDVLIATPGRMIDLFERGNILLHDIKIFVIDEADRMLDMGFIPDIEKIAGLLPKLRQTLFFSATMPPEMRKLAAQFLMNPKEVSVSPPATTATTVQQWMLRVDIKRKREALRGLLQKEAPKNAFIFCNRKKDIGGLGEFLRKNGFNAAALHGYMPQTLRDQALEKFRSNEVAFLVCSDVAARGLDIKGVDAVFNYDVPFNSEDYVHRIGRTGRAGSAGHAYTLVTSEDDKLLQNIVSLIRQPIPEMSLHEVVQAAEAPSPSPGPTPTSAPAPEQRQARQHDRHPPRERHQPRNNQQKHPQNNTRRAPEGGQTVGFGDDLPKFLSKSRIASESSKEDRF